MLMNFTWSAGRPRAWMAASMALRCTGGMSTGIPNCAARAVTAARCAGGRSTGICVGVGGTEVGTGVGVTSTTTGPPGVAHAATNRLIMDRANNRRCMDCLLLYIPIDASWSKFVPKT